MSINSFDRLQKEIDALTYNARSVLQALQESALAGGTSKGFRVVRANKEITLTRVDIYRLYTFYQEWEANNFSLVDVSGGANSRPLLGFDTIRRNHDKTVVKDDYGNSVDSSATTTALAKHGRIMYLNKDNMDAYDDDSIWYLKIASASNPKLVTNSSPIPVNLRTPIQDHNLSTKHYHAHPTYLLPSSYYLPDIIGYEGDGVDHYLDGDSWSISGKNSVRIESEHVSIGTIDNSNVYKTKAKRHGLNALAWGYDSFASTSFATAGGYKSCATEMHAIALGNTQFASGVNSASIGGFGNSSIFDNSTVIGGYMNQSSGNNSSVIGGQYNVVGEPAYDFEMVYVSGNTECVVNCSAECGAENSQTIISNPAYLVMRIKKNISSIQIKVGDSVALYGFSVSSTKSTSASTFEVGGDLFGSINRSVVSITADPTQTTWSIITLDKSVPASHIVGGKIVRVNELILNESGISSGTNSATVGGYSLVAAGKNQLVIGVCNRYVTGNAWDSTYDARMIVGSGYYSVGDKGVGYYTRQNIMEVYDNSYFVSLTGVRYGNTFSGFSGGKNKLTANGTLNEVAMAWNLNASGESIIKVHEVDGEGNGVLLSSKASILVDSIASIKHKANSYLVNSVYETHTIKTTYSVASRDIYFNGNTSTHVHGYDLFLSSGRKTQIAYGTRFECSGDRNGSYGYTMTPLSKSDSFTNAGYGGDSLTPNTIFKTCVAEVKLPSKSTVYMHAEYPPDSYLGLLDSTTSVRRAHVMTFAGTPEGVNNTGDSSLMQMIWGECTPGNLRYNTDAPTTKAWSGGVCVRKGRVVDGNAEFTSWENLVVGADMDAAFNAIKGTAFYTKSSVVAMRVGSDNNFATKSWVNSQMINLDTFTMRITQSGNISTMNCNFWFSTAGVSDSRLVAFIIDLGADYKRFRPLYDTISPVLYASTTDTTVDCVIYPWGAGATENLNVSHLAFINGSGINNTGTDVDGKSIYHGPVVVNDSKLEYNVRGRYLRVIIDTSFITEASRNIVGRFNVSYENGVSR